MQALFFLGFWLAFMIGWIANIWQVATLAFANSPITSYFVLKAVAIIIAPVGSILGWFGMF